MSRLLTPEHFQLLSTRRLTDAIAPTETTDEDDPTVRMARYELRRRECAIPVRKRYDSVAAVTAERSPARSA